MLGYFTSAGCIWEFASVCRGVRLECVCPGVNEEFRSGAKFGCA